MSLGLPLQRIKEQKTLLICHDIHANELFARLNMFDKPCLWLQSIDLGTGVICIIPVAIKKTLEKGRQILYWGFMAAVPCHLL